MTKVVLATHDITVNINGVDYDCLLIPKEDMVDIDYSEAPELHPMVKGAINAVKNKALPLENFGYYDEEGVFVATGMEDEPDA